MRKNRICRHETQLNLFHPLPKTPSWAELPVDTGRKAVNLLARLLREHRSRLLASDSVGEVSDK